MRQFPLLLLCVASLLVAAVPAHAAVAGDLDPSFSGDGRQTTDFAGGYERGSGVAVQPDGKVVVVGSISTNPFYSDPVGIAIARYNRDGSLDPNFSGDGKVTLRFPNATIFTSDVAIQGDRIVVAGSYRYGPGENDNSDFLALRLNSNGRLDPRFSGDGRALVDFGNRDYVGGGVLDSRGRIVLAGSTTTGDGSRDFAVTRLETSGSVDATFSGDGRQTTDFAGSGDSGSGVAIQPDGKVVVAGNATVDRESEEFGEFEEVSLALARYNADGTLDPTFSGDGRDATYGRWDNGGASDLAIQPDGKIVVTGGCCYDIYGGTSVLARYNPSGGLDRSFSPNLSFGGSNALYGVALQRDGKIVVAGDAVLRYVGAYFALARLDTSGGLDRSFSRDGKTLTEFPTSGDVEASDVKVQPDGKIVAAGTGGSGLALARYLGAAPARNCTIKGTSRGDVLVGTPGDDVICAGDGNDVVRAEGGDDTVYGGPGNDVLRGDRGSDRLHGGAGKDVLHGAAGSDRLFGDLGTDALDSRDGVRANDLADGGGNRDACKGDRADRRRSCIY